MIIIGGNGMERFQLKPTIYFGPDALAALGELTVYDRTDVDLSLIHI